jgi:hypothetical protein
LTIDDLVDTIEGSFEERQLRKDFLNNVYKEKKLIRHKIDEMRKSNE